MIDKMFDGGAMPVLERMLQFTSTRHKMIVNNIANISTPHFKPQDLSVESFQKALGDAIDQRRAGGQSNTGTLELNDTRELSFEKDGMTARPNALNENILFHDQNNRDVERMMQRLAENTMAHRVSIDLVRSEFDLIRMAIRERV